jgi:hypothetical protein
MYKSKTYVQDDTYKKKLVHMTINKEKIVINCLNALANLKYNQDESFINNLGKINDLEKMTLESLQTYENSYEIIFSAKKDYFQALFYIINPKENYLKIIEKFSIDYGFSVDNNPDQDHENFAKEIALKIADKYGFITSDLEEIVTV